jgi:transcriptional regulator with XRE-family HTH domain
LPRLNKDDLAFYDAIAERIREILQDSHPGTTVATLAAHIGWNRSSLSNFLNRKTQTISTHLLAKTAKALNVPVDYLMSDYGRPDTNSSADTN